MTDIPNRVVLVIGNCGTGHEIAGQPVAAFSTSEKAHEYVDATFPKPDPNGDPFYDTDTVSIWSLVLDEPDYPGDEVQRLRGALREMTKAAQDMGRTLTLEFGKSQFDANDILRSYGIASDSEIV